MDPATITTLITSAIQLSYQIATNLVILANKTTNISTTLHDFASEINGLSLTLTAVGSTLNDTRLDLIGSSPSTNEDVWRALFGSLDSIRLYLERLKHEYPARNGETSLLEQAKRALRLHLHQDGISKLRDILRTHQLTLNTALLMLQVYVQARIPALEPSTLESDICRLKDMMNKLRSSSTENLAPSSVHIAGNVVQLLQAANRIASDASEKAISMAGSEPYLPINKTSRREVDNWLMRLPSISLPQPESNGTELSTAHSISSNISRLSQELPQPALSTSSQIDIAEVSLPQNDGPASTRSQETQDHRPQYNVKVERKASSLGLGTDIEAQAGMKDDSKKHQRLVRGHIQSNEIDTGPLQLGIRGISITPVNDDVQEDTTREKIGHDSDQAHSQQEQNTKLTTPWKSFSSLFPERFRVHPQQRYGESDPSDISPQHDSSRSVDRSTRILSWSLIILRIIQLGLASVACAVHIQAFISPSQFSEAGPDLRWICAIILAALSIFYIVTLKAVPGRFLLCFRMKTWRVLLSSFVLYAFPDLVLL